MPLEQFPSPALRGTMDGKHSLRRRGAAAVIAMLPVAAWSATVAPSAHAATASVAIAPGHAAKVAVVVRAMSGHVDDAKRLVGEAGGTVTLDLGIIDGFGADVPGDAVAALQASPFVDSVTTDARVHMNSD